MFILGIIIDIIHDLTRLRYGHNLSVCHIVSGISNHVGLLMKLSLLIVQVNSYVLLNKPGEFKNHIDPLQVRGNKCAGDSNRTIGNIGCLES